MGQAPHIQVFSTQTKKEFLKSPLGVTQGNKVDIVVGNVGRMFFELLDVNNSMKELWVWNIAWPTRRLLVVKHGGQAFHKVRTP